MRSKPSSPKRSEVSEHVENSNRDMREKTEEAAVFANDLDVVRHTLDGLERSGTQEGVDDVLNGIEVAHDITVDGFDAKSEQLERVQDGAETYKTDLADRSGRSESDKTKISDAITKVDTQQTRTAMDRAAHGVQKDIQFLSIRIHEIGEGLAKSEQDQAHLRSRVHGSGGA